MALEKTNKLYYSWNEFDQDVHNLVNQLNLTKYNIQGIYAIPKGGLTLGVYLANVLNVPLYDTLYGASKVIKDKKNILIVDDISDSGQTLLKYDDIKEYTTTTLFMKLKSKFKPKHYCRICPQDVWIVYPWEELKK